MSLQIEQIHRGYQNLTSFQFLLILQHDCNNERVLILGHKRQFSSLCVNYLLLAGCKLPFTLGLVGLPILGLNSFRKKSEKKKVSRRSNIGESFDANSGVSMRKSSWQIFHTAIASTNIFMLDMIVCIAM